MENLGFPILNFILSNYDSHDSLSIDSLSINHLATQLSMGTCYSASSLIRCRNRITNEISDIPASNVTSNLHDVFSIDEQKFVRVIYNVVAGITSRYMLIKKNAIAENEPSEDFYITSGHILVIDGIEAKAINIKQAKRIKVKPETMYTICTEKRGPILINGLEVMAWGREEWMDYCLRKNIIWRDNESPYDINSMNYSHNYKNINNNNICENGYGWNNYIKQFFSQLFF